MPRLVERLQVSTGQGRQDRVAQARKDISQVEGQTATGFQQVVG